MPKRRIRVIRGIIGLLLAFGATSAGQSNDTRRTYEAASIRPNVSGSGSSSTNGSRGQIAYTNVTLKSLITGAFDVKPFQVTGPGWMESARFDIVAKYPEAVDRGVRKLMLRNLLEDRFSLVVHKEVKEMPGYTLVAAKNGFKLRPISATGTNSSSNSNGRVQTVKATGMTMAQLADTLSHLMGAMVVDRTEISGVYEIDLKWNLDDQNATSDPDAPPSLFTALRETLGLRLVSQKVPVEIVVVDRVERMPTEN